MALKTMDWKREIVSTSGLTTSTVTSYTVPNGSSVYMEATIIGRDTTTGDTVVVKLGAGAKRVAGTTALVGAVQNILPAQASATLAAVVLTIDVSTPDVRVRATGISLLTIEWQADLKIWIN